MFSIRAAVTLSLLALAGIIQAADRDRPVYELRVYTCEPGKLTALHERFRDHTMRIFEKHGMKNVGYWTPVDATLAANTLIYLLEHQSRQAAEESWDAFRNDPEWRKVAADSREQHGKILAHAPVSTWLVKTDYSPEITTPAAGRLFELRTYTAAPGKLDALNARFRDHTDRLFQRHGMHSFGYWVPQEQPNEEKQLVYILVHDNPAAAKTSWQAFLSDPDWQKAFQESQHDGSLTARKPELVYMTLTDFSPAVEAEEQR